MSLLKTCFAPSDQKNVDLLKLTYQNRPNKNLIPSGTVTFLRFIILPGGHSDPSQGWTNGLATVSKTGSVYIRAECSVTDGRHIGKKFEIRIGLKSPKGPWWRKRGRELILNILNSKHALSKSENSEKALRCRRLKSLKDLDGSKFQAKIKIAKDFKGYEINEIDEVIIPQDSDIEVHSPRLRQTDLTSKLTAAVSAPMWMRE